MVGMTTDSNSTRAVMLMKLLDWAGRPQTHIVGLFVSLLAAVFVVAFMIGTLEYTKTRGVLLLTTFLVGGYFLTMLVATGIPPTGVGRRLRPAAFAVATVALFLLLLGLWGRPNSNEFWKSAAIVTLLALGLALTGNTIAKASGDWVVGAWVGATAALSGLLTLVGALGIAAGITSALYWWVFVLVTLLWLAFAAAIPVVRRFRRTCTDT